MSSAGRALAGAERRPQKSAAATKKGFDAGASVEAIFCCRRKLGLGRLSGQRSAPPGARWATDLNVRGAPKSSSICCFQQNN